jgi:geranylgeranyl transferase type-1 subunit beta
VYILKRPVDPSCYSHYRSPTTSDSDSVLRMAQLDTSKFVGYVMHCLKLLPSSVTSMDLNRISIGFLLLNILDILDKLDTASPAERRHWIDWIYGCQLPTGGFRGSPATKVLSTSVFDTTHLPATYFAIATLLILGDDLKRVNRGGALSGLKASQNEDGSFSPVLLGDGEKFGEVDVRHTYCAIAIREMLSPIKADEDIDVSAAESYIQKCKVIFLVNFAYDSAMMEDMHRVRNWNLTVAGALGYANL